MVLDFNGITLCELLLQKTTCTGTVYRDFLARNFEIWLGRRKRGEIMLPYGNAGPHTAAVVRDFLGAQNIDTWKHPGYLPKISRLDHDCFAKLKRKLQGFQIENLEKFEQVLTEVVYDLRNHSAMTAATDVPQRSELVLKCKGEYL